MAGTGTKSVDAETRPGVDAFENSFGMPECILYPGDDGFDHNPDAQTYDAKNKTRGWNTPASIALHHKGRAHESMYGHPVQDSAVSKHSDSETESEYSATNAASVQLPSIRFKLFWHDVCRKDHSQKSGTSAAQKPKLFRLPCIEGPPPISTQYQEELNKRKFASRHRTSTPEPQDPDITVDTPPAETQETPLAETQETPLAETQETPPAKMQDIPLTGTQNSGNFPCEQFQTPSENSPDEMIVDSQGLSSADAMLPDKPWLSFPDKPWLSFPDKPWLSFPDRPELSSPDAMLIDEPKRSQSVQHRPSLTLVLPSRKPLEESKRSLKVCQRRTRTSPPTPGRRLRICQEVDDLAIDVEEKLGLGQSDMDDSGTPRSSSPPPTTPLSLSSNDTGSEAGQSAQEIIEDPDPEYTSLPQSDNDSVSTVINPKRADTPVPEKSSTCKKYVEIHEGPIASQNDNEYDFVEKRTEPPLSTIEEIRSRKKVKPKRRTGTFSEIGEVLD